MIVGTLISLNLLNLFWIAAHLKTHKPLHERVEETVNLEDITSLTAAKPLKIPYNIGDFIRSKWYRETGFANGRIRNNYAAKFIKRYPDSICAEYYSLNSPDKQHINSYYDDKNINYDLLNAIVDRKAKMKGITPTENDIYIHLRIGDVIDWRPNNYLKTNKKNYKEYLNKTQQHRNGGHYVQPLKYFEDQEKKIFQMLAPDTKIIVIAYKYDKDMKSNSYKYTMAIHDFFVEKNYNVEITYNNNADVDFILMSSAKYFVRTGGGFNKLIAKLVQNHGGHVFGPL